MKDLYVLLGSLVIAILGAFGLYSKGRKDGRAKSEADKLRSDAAISLRRAEDATTSGHVSADVSALPSGDASKRLHDKWTRES